MSKEDDRMSVAYIIVFSFFKIFFFNIFIQLSSLLIVFVDSIIFEYDCFVLNQIFIAHQWFKPRETTHEEKNFSNRVCAMLNWYCFEQGLFLMNLVRLKFLFSSRQRAIERAIER